MSIVWENGDNANCHRHVMCSPAQNSQGTFRVSHVGTFWHFRTICEPFQNVAEKPKDVITMTVRKERKNPPFFESHLAIYMYQQAVHIYRERC